MLSGIPVGLLLVHPDSSYHLLTKLSGLDASSDDEQKLQNGRECPSYGLFAQTAMKIPVPSNRKAYRITGRLEVGQNMGYWSSSESQTQVPEDSWYQLQQMASKFMNDSKLNRLTRHTVNPTYLLLWSYSSDRNGALIRLFQCLMITLCCTGIKT
jgi:hypothetical protein